VRAVESPRLVAESAGRTGLFSRSSAGEPALPERETVSDR